MKRMNIVLTREQVRRVDRLAIEEFGILGLVLMENAGRNAAAILLDHLRDDPADGVVIYCGTGNNGGDGLVIARHLVNAGIAVRIGLAGEADRLTPDAAANYRTCSAMEIPIAPAGSITVRAEEWVVDALLGTGFKGAVRESMAGLIDRINASPKRGVAAIDVPSGLDCDTGQASNATIVADLTVTFVADKVGFGMPGAKRFVGFVHVADIGAPAEAVRRALEP